MNTAQKCGRRHVSPSSISSAQLAPPPPPPPRRSCLIAHAANASQWMTAIHCLETHGTSQSKFLDTCAAQSNYAVGEISKCRLGAEGAALDQAAYKATPADHQYVPWVTVNGVNICTEAGCDDVLAGVCKAYTGAKPAACTAATAKHAKGALRARQNACPAQW